MTKSSVRIAALASALACLFVCAARADVRELVNAGKVTWTGGPEVIYLNADGTPATADAYDHLVLKFTDTTAAGSLTVDDSVRANARILVVGGGGAGGSATGSYTGSGAGGGGGAGGFIDMTHTLGGGIYTINVGTGGVAAAAKAQLPGGNGGSSWVRNNGVNIFEAFGGGGGGAACAGLSGASGGGGSQKYASSTSTPHDGGANYAGQGNVGGRGVVGRSAGGGGGAGSAGGDSRGSNIGGIGGAGLPSSILLDSEGNEIYYAGGGGGGTRNQVAGDTRGNGGLGGGGTGGGDTVASPGGANTGGGGGGGTLTTAGANGGSGVVIVRITQLVETQVALPTVEPKVFNKDNQIALDFGIAYTYVSGVTNATAAGNYSFVVKPGTDLEWNAAAGGGTGEKTINWSISKRTIEKPVPANFTYDGTEKIGVTYGDDFLEYCTFDASSVTNATNGGTYTYTVSLNDIVNTAWDGNSTDPIDGSWTIAAAKIDRPTIATTSFTYDSNAKTVLELSGTEQYELAGGTLSATDGGDYTFTLSLKGNTATVTNYVWNVAPATSEPYVGEWTIAAAENAITSLKMTGWRIGVGTPTEPEIEANFGKERVTYEYGFGSTEEEVTDWITDKNAITNSGTWIVRATIDATENWTKAVKTATFGMWTDPRKAFRNHVDITINPGNTTTLINFPALVKISETRIRGFLYSEAGTTGHDIAFMPMNATADTDPLPCEVDTWNKNGESYIWVGVPEIPVGGTTITMYWYLGDGMAAPPVDSTAVWTNDYIGVWHMNEADKGAATVVDSSGHMNGVGHAKSIVGDGIFGKARGRNEERVNGPTMTVQPYAELNALVPTFTVSGWLKSTLQTPYYSYIFSRKSSDGYASWGAQWRGSGGNASKLAIYSSGDADDDNKRNVFDTNARFPKDKWVKYDVVYTATTVALYLDGAIVGTTQTIKPSGGAKSGDLPFAVGGFTGDTGNSTVHGLSDEVRLRKGAISADWVKAEYAMVTDDSALVYSPIVHDGIMENWWVEEPTMDKTSWDVKDTPGVITNPGVLADGAVSNYIYSVYDPTQTFESTTSLTNAGYYRVVFLPVDQEKYEPISHTIEIHVVESQPYSGICGNNGDSGRILLMNNHTWSKNSATNVDYQGWFDADNAGANNGTTSTYWHHENLGTPSVAGFNLKDGTESVLYAADGRRLWHIVNCRHGNTFPATVADPLGTLQNYLPWNSTSSRNINDHTINKRTGLQTVANRSTVGQLVMQNTSEAVVYSSCFTNGIGTIYFDAVNGWCRDDENYENYKIVVEIATNTVFGLEPTDENCVTYQEETDSESGEVVSVTTNWYGNVENDEVSCWHAVPVIPYKRDGTTNFEKGEKTEELTLDVENGGTMDNFFRVVVPLDIAGPVRFRIRRTTRVPGSSFGVDEGGFILLDNIIASIPAMSADLVSAGHYDEEKSGSQTLGWELATSVPYPSVGDIANIVPYAKPEFTLNVGGGSTPDTTKFFSSATMHYRWRYLNQTLNQPVSAWKDIALNPGDNFKAIRPLELPSRPGDVEYWFEYRLQAPYYKYVDYSGAANAAIDYTEERGVLTNHLNDPTVPTGGSDWFFRLREGKSDYSGLDVVFRRGSSAAEERVHLSLVDDHVWRGFVQTKENQTGEISYRIEALDEQTAEFAEYAAKTNYWRCNVDNPRFPVSEALVPVGEGSWSKLTLDATTGYVMFQIDDTEKSSMALTVVHADYQNANGWSDALGRKDSQGRGPIFVGTSTTNAYKIGVSPSKQTFSEDFGAWGTMPATNQSWTFPTGLTDIKPNHMYGRQSYVSFASDTNGLWDVGQGMWVAKQYRDDRDNAGVALQMEGQGKGYLHFTDTSNAPRGLESISFNARLGQFVTFDDFAYYYAENILNLQNYTFMARTAFDLKDNQGFKGNASLSLAAYYLPNKGCYEARWEWLGNNSNKKRGQRLCLYRWNVTSAGGKKATLIVARTNTVYDVNGVTKLDVGSSYKFIPMFISVTSDASGTTVIAGVRRAGESIGYSPLKNASGYTTSSDNYKWFGVCYRDTSASRLTRGSYGVISANCDGVFARPEFSHTVQSTVGAFPGNNKATDSFEREVLSQVDDLQNIKNCAEDDLQNAEYPGWNIIPGRLTTTYTSPSVNAIMSSVSAQTLQIFLGTAGRADWGSTPYETVAVDGFGGGGTYDIPLYSTKNCSIRFSLAGSSDDIRTDVVLDSVTMKQWRGGNWDDPDVWPILPEWADDQHRNKAVGHTNFVFTSAWTTNHTVLLSAKRAGLDMPSAVRSPLMDGFADDGSHGTGYVRGIGLGMISIAYANAQENAVLSLQIATNGVDYTTIGGYDKSFSTNIWTTITNFNFSSMTAAQRKKGILNTYLGLHDVKGAMRVMVPTNTILAVKNTTDTSKFGDVTITSITCSDEPPVDVHSWWGWNIRTVGGDQDSEKMMFLDDFSTEAGGSGLSLAINNSVDENYTVSRIDVSDRESYIQHKPFVQTPTFTSNIVGEVVFRARKYGENDPTATVTVYGSRNATETDEGKWERIDGAVFMVSNAWYETYRAKMDPRYKAFRLAVAGVEGVVENSDGGGNGLPAGAYDPPPRVLLDEMFVSEAVNAIMGFKNVGCFRHDMSGLGEVPNVPSRDEQPICEEAWGVQCEIYGAQLASDIDFTHTPRVKLHWFNGIAPWGYENWKDSPGANSAWLSRAIETEEDRFVYRSTMRTSPDAVVPMSFVAPSYVQYTLEVVFYTKENPTVPVTNWLASSDWKIPEWYRPLDLNAQYGNGTDFAAYNILDNVAPGWAWINEVNLFGDFVKWNNTDENCQFVEIAHPPEADVSGWSVRLLEGQMGNNWVITNDLARFGRDGLSGTKQLPAEDAEVNMVFRVIGSPLSRSSGRLKKSDGTLDGVWKVDNPTQVFTSDGVISYYDPVVFQLVRTSGIVEHEIIVEGTNYLESLEIESPGYLGEMRDWMAARMPGSDVVMTGYDFGGPANSLSVTQHFGRCGMTVAPDDWNHPTNDWKTIVKMTPGHRNVGQVIDPNHPVPAGEEVLVYFTVAGDHIEQSLDGSNFTNGMFSAIVTKNNPVGTNVVYRVDPWYVLDNVRTGSVSLVGQVQQTKTTQPFEYTLSGVAKGVSNNVTVVATAALNPKFGTDWGVPEDDPYRDAIIDWLEGGTDLYGNPFSDVESGEIRLATHRSWWSGAVMTNLTLREMYWLDMDPTVGKLSLLAGTAFDPNGIEHVVTKAMGESTVVMTNRRLYVYMMISNENETVEAPAHPRGIHDFTTHWTPYVLRGLEPGEHSQNYVVSTGDWESVTFKITGMLMNGATSFYVADNKVPLRHFTFNEKSFSAEGLSKVEVYDPYSPLSVGYNAGWKRWWDKNGYCPVVFFWMIDTRLPPIGVEQLQEDNYYGD